MLSNIIGVLSKKINLIDLGKDFFRFFKKVYKIKLNFLNL